MNTRSAREALSEVNRELGVRRRCYARWIQDGKLSEVEACDRMERLDKAAELIERSILLQEAATRPLPAENDTRPVSVARAAVAPQDAVLSPELVTCSAPHVV